ncbi:MAG: carbohydrate ABC transporter permease [Nitrospinota bacterium]|nr:MAG: carbohydrate ABC transporter permease [Nitrospinota bacterium]
MKKRLSFQFLIHAILIIAILLIAFPVIFAFIVSTHAYQDVFPPRFSLGRYLWENYTQAWKQVNMGRLLWNSTLISVAVSLGKIVLSLMAAFAFTYFGDFRGKGFFFVIILITHMLPLPIRIVPTFELMQDFNWVNTYYALTIPFFASATGTLLFRQLFLTVPLSLSDAARIDGAGPISFLVRILVPLARTNIAALFMIEFIYMWNQYLWPLVVTNSDEMRVVQIGIKMLLLQQAQAAEWNVIMAGTIIAMLPPLIVLFLLQKSFVQGFAMQEEK